MRSDLKFDESATPQAKAAEAQAKREAVMAEAREKDIKARGLDHDPKDNDPEKVHPRTAAAIAKAKANGTYKEPKAKKKPAKAAEPKAESKGSKGGGDVKPAE